MQEDIARLELVNRDELHVRPLAQVRVEGTDEFTGVALARDLLQLRLRMVEQEANRLSARIPGAADDRYPNHDPLSVPFNAS